MRARVCAYTCACICVQKVAQTIGLTLYIICSLYAETVFPFQELEKWMNDSIDGFIYFTFGSMVMIETFPNEFLKVLYVSLGKIAPIRILMKIPNPEKLPSGLPGNIYMSPWMPQIKVLSEYHFCLSILILPYCDILSVLPEDFISKTLKY